MAFNRGNKRKFETIKSDDFRVSKPKSPMRRMKDEKNFLKSKGKVSPVL
jgi:hypothetical protein